VDFVIIIETNKLHNREKIFLEEILSIVHPIRIEYKFLEREIENDGRSKRELMDTKFYNDHGCDFYFLFKKNHGDENYNIYEAEKNTG
jgi:hypothetical protein